MFYTEAVGLTSSSPAAAAAAADLIVSTPFIPFLLMNFLALALAELPFNPGFFIQSPNSLLLSHECLDNLDNIKKMIDYGLLAKQKELGDTLIPVCPSLAFTPLKQHTLYNSKSGTVHTTETAYLV
ncbi:hypothetical protein STEG23_032813 [Scotinomys teguina]